MAAIYVPARMSVQPACFWLSSRSVESLMMRLSGEPRVREGFLVRDAGRVPSRGRCSAPPCG